jgi:glycine cleavage system aminomethyltransferase T
MGFGQMQTGQVQQISFFMISVTVIRDSWTGSDGIEMIVPSMAAPIAAGAIHKYKEKEGIVPAGMEVLNKNLPN